MTEKERAKQLAEEHWGYVEGVILAAKYEVSDSVMKEITYHYKTALIHGYGHAIEDERNGMFRPSIGEPLTTEEVAAIARPCSNCYDEKECGGGLRLASGDCLHYWAKDNVRCSDCRRKPECANPCDTGRCSLFYPKGAK